MSKTTTKDAENGDEDDEQQYPSWAAVNRRSEKEIIRNVWPKCYRRNFNDLNSSVNK